MLYNLQTHVHTFITKVMGNVITTWHISMKRMENFTSSTFTILKLVIAFIPSDPTLIDDLLNLFQSEKFQVRYRT